MLGFVHRVEHFHFDMKTQRFKTLEVFVKSYKCTKIIYSDAGDAGYAGY